MDGFNVEVVKEFSSLIVGKYPISLAEYFKFNYRLNPLHYHRMERDSMRKLLLILIFGYSKA